MIHRLLLEASKAGIMPPYPLKEFVPKFKLPVLERYDVRAHRNYWCHWPKNYKLEHETNINFDLFRKLAIDAVFEDRELLEVVYSDLKCGAHLIIHHRHVNLETESVTQYVNVYMLLDYFNMKKFQNMRKFLALW